MLDIQANGNLEAQAAQPPGTVNIYGGNITLTNPGGEVGNPASPLVIQANSVGRQRRRRAVWSMSPRRGTSAWFKLGRPAGRHDPVNGPWRVAVSAPVGSILNAATWVAGGLSLAQAEADWKALARPDPRRRNSRSPPSRTR